MGTAARAPAVSLRRRHDAQVLPHADGLEGYAREIEPARAAHFVFAVDMVLVASREGVQALPGDPQQVGAGAIDQGLNGTGAHAARHRQLARGDQRLTQGALHDPGGQGLIVLEGRDIKRAGDHAVAAAHADRAVPNDPALLGLGKGPDETGRSAGRLQAVLALVLAEDRARRARDACRSG